MNNFRVANMTGITTFFILTLPIWGILAFIFSWCWVSFRFGFGVAVLLIIAITFASSEIICQAADKDIGCSLVMFGL